MDPLITPEMLAQTGIIIADNEVEAYLDLMNDTLTERIGEAITESLTDEQLDTLSSLEETASDEQLNDWLRKNVTDMDTIIQDEIDIILGDAAENSGTINSLDQ
jgi:hypothetical protein